MKLNVKTFLALCHVYDASITEQSRCLSEAVGISERAARKAIEGYGTARDLPADRFQRALDRAWSDIGIKTGQS